MTGTAAMGDRDPRTYRGTLSICIEKVNRLTQESGNDTSTVWVTGSEAYAKGLLAELMEGGMGLDPEKLTQDFVLDGVKVCLSTLGSYDAWWDEGTCMVEGGGEMWAELFGYLRPKELDDAQAEVYHTLRDADLWDTKDALVAALIVA